MLGVDGVWSLWWGFYCAMTSYNIICYIDVSNFKFLKKNFGNINRGKILIPVVHRAMGCGQNKLLVSVAVPPAPVRFPSQRPLVPSQSRRSLMIRVMIKWSWGLCTDLMAFALQLRKPQKTSTRRPPDEGMTSHCLKWGPLPPNDVSRIAQHIKKGEGRKGLVGYKWYSWLQLTFY